MTIFLIAVIVVVTFSYIAYPFFGKTVAAPVNSVKRQSERRTVNQTQKTRKKRSDIDSEIEKQVNEIRNKDNKTICPKCGSRYSEGSRFCTQCGAELVGKINKNED